MAKTKSKAVLSVADGTGGLAQEIDHRFDRTQWPIQFDVDPPQADTWLQYLGAECSKRNWGSSGLGQIDAKENSGSITVTSGPPGQPQLALVWERRRDGPLRLRARSVGEPGFPVSEVQAFLQQVTDACRSAVKERVRVRGQLVYEGAPWRGEFWLTDSLRLGPSSKQDEAALWGSRVIVVETFVDAIDRLDAGSVSQVLMRDLSVFLTVVLRMSVTVEANGRRGWTWTVGPTGKVECEMRQLGYREAEYSPEMPLPGSSRPTPTTPVRRPDFSEGGLRADVQEQKVPVDIVDLWRAFADLAPETKDQFRRAASLWQLALSASHDYQTTKFSLMATRSWRGTPALTRPKRASLHSCALSPTSVPLVHRLDCLDGQH